MKVIPETPCGFNYISMLLLLSLGRYRC